MVVIAPLAGARPFLSLVPPRDRRTSTRPDHAADVPVAPRLAQIPVEAPGRVKGETGRAVEDRQRLLGVSIPVLKARDERDRIQRLLRAVQVHSNVSSMSDVASSNERSFLVCFAAT